MTDKSVVSLLPSFRKEGCPLGRGGRHPWVCAFILSLAYVLASCTQEPLLPYDGAQQEYMNFSLELTPPGSFTPADTRAMTPAKQNAVSSAVVLVFKDNKLLFHHAGTVSDVDGAGGIKKKVNVTLKTSQSESDLFDIMVIGNPPTYFSFASYVGKAKSELKAGFNVAVAGKWAGSEFIMYGEVLQTLVKPSTKNFNIQLLRSLARVDIGVGVYKEAGDTWAGLPGFKLTEVRVVNSRDKFAAIPAATTFNESGNVKVSVPTIPADAGLQGTTAADAITYPAGDITSGVYTKSTIFLAEAPNTIGSRVTLLVGGSYKGGATTYYRIDMCVPRAGAPGTFDYFNILRNHLYRISITGVSGAGFADPQEALLSGPINITTTLTPIEEGGAGDVVFDGNNYIHTDASSVLIYGAPDGVKTYQIATVKAGFAAGVPATITGLGITSAIPLTSGVATPVSVALPAGTTTGNLTIKVGRLSKTISVRVVGPPIDAHFDFLPFQNVQSINITNPQPWLTLSQSTTYVKSEQQSSYIVGNSTGKACFHFDENIATTGAPRMAQALLRRSNSGETTCVIFEQRNLAGMVLGYFGGAKDAYGYTKQLAVESIEEYSQRVYDDTSIGTIIYGVLWGFYRVSTNVTEENFGQPGTIALVKRTDSGITPPYTIYRTYAARYCYDKNRDINGNGGIDDNEVVWYLPAQNQLQAAWIAQEGITSPFGGSEYWTATEREESDNCYVHFGNGNTYSYYDNRTEVYRVRCVREI